MIALARTGSISARTACSRRSFSWRPGRGAAVAKEVVPAGVEYPYQLGLWYVWSVKMAEPHLPPGSYSYSTGLSAFIPADELGTIFKDRFAGVGVLV